MKTKPSRCVCQRPDSKKRDANRKITINTNLLNVPLSVMNFEKYYAAAQYVAYLWRI
jgi:hypothetical protein